jgi:hypothetical protein
MTNLYEIRFRIQYGLRKFTICKRGEKRLEFLVERMLD